MKILLTGYKGFIGKNFLNNAEFKQYDIGLLEWGDDLPDVSKYDWVIHLGANSSTTCTQQEARTMNYEFTCWLYDECCRHGVNLQYSSSASVYGNKNRTFKETDKKHPESWYAKSKSDIEDYILANPCDDIIVQGFRYFNVYGPHEEHKGNMASPQTQFLNQARKDGVIKLFEGSNRFKRDFVHVNTVIKTHLDFLDIHESGIWNIGSGRPKSFLDIAYEIQEFTKCKVTYIPFPDHLKGHYQEYTCADLTELDNTLDAWDDYIYRDWANTK